MSEACAHERHDEREPTAPCSVSDDELFEHLEQILSRKPASLLRRSGLFKKILEATNEGLQAARAAEGEQPSLVSVIHHALTSVFTGRGARSIDFTAMTSALEQLESVHLGNAEGADKEASNAVAEGVLAQLKTLLHAEPVRREQPKVGRNDPCPCGSHKKFKKCCWKKQQQEEE
ncbi:hypothetical protein A2412_03065 [Candidatus Peribacteria bacterium RIFOXYC1_FULL_58_8]|nr:MAG: hypothetical protein A2412_03065 [Candidatus Peribacteria bacterium RIFOXYC1_FULL_58_8]